MEDLFVIVGGGLAGAMAAQTLREEGFAGRITVLCAEDHRPYERPPLSKAYLSGSADRESVFVHPDGWYAEHDVTLLAGVRATAVDPQAHTVATSDGSLLRYTKLLLATGSTPRPLPAAGADLDGVHYLRTVADADSLAPRLVEGARVVVVGGGWIGLEVAAAARAAKADVTVVETAAMPLQRVLGREVARVFVDLHEANGVRVISGASVRELLGSGRVETVKLTDGTQLAADLVVVGIGAQPNLELAVDAGLDVGDGVLADASLRTSDPDIFAAGDVAAAEHPMLGRRVRVEHWANARHSGVAAAKAMLGQPVRYDRVPYFYTDQYTSHPSIGMEYAGWALPGEYDEVVFRGDPAVRPDASPEFIAFWLKGGCVLAGMNVNVWDVQENIQALVRAGYAGKQVDPKKLSDPDVPLSELVP
ncbi:MAG: FAD-dependent oxidoreductase [Micromonosporaceae bacterium]|nr:FAD-dependent oxidoreductase [Micromonosporaceae bacterium]